MILRTRERHENQLYNLSRELPAVQVKNALGIQKISTLSS